MVIADVGARGVVVDLTGTPPPWDDDLVRAWHDCLARAARDVPAHVGPDRDGDPLLREAVARRTGLPADRLVITGGIRSAAAALLARATTVVVEEPTFADVPRALAARGASVERARWEDLPSVVGGADAVWLTPVLRNPDGRDLDPAIAADLAAALDDDAQMVWDTAFAWFAPAWTGGAAPAPPRTHVLGSLHKLVGPGARLGWALPATDDVDVRRALWTTAPAPLWQRAWASMFECGVLDDLRDRLVRDLGRAVPAFLEGAGLPDRATAPHLLLDVADEADAVRRMAERGVHVGAGTAFDALSPSIRVCLLGVDAGSARIAGQAFARLAEDDPRR